MPMNFWTLQYYFLTCFSYDKVPTINIVPLIFIINKSSVILKKTFFVTYLLVQISITNDALF